VLGGDNGMRRPIVLRFGFSIMSELWWTVLGLVGGLLLMVPVTRMLLRLGERRARDAERRARDSERLAELGSMTGGLAHEIKNPLSTIGLNAQLLAEEIAESQVPMEQRERLIRRLDALSRETERLRGILNDFLQFAGRIKLDPQPHDVRTLVDELSDFFLPQSAQAGVLLRTQLPDEPVLARIDERLLKQALLNLMLNATQAMSGERVVRDGPPEPAHAARKELILKVEGDDREARIHVIDTGPGIAAARLEEIFRPYVTGRAGGTGLGLPTAKRIVEEHGGCLTVISEPGRGSDFVVSLPMAFNNANPDQMSSGLRPKS
jgi:signal transduction histidine kinase